MYQKFLQFLQLFFRNWKDPKSESYNRLCFVMFLNTSKIQNRPDCAGRF